jgi:hypothetical protein
MVYLQSLLFATLALAVASAKPLASKPKRYSPYGQATASPYLNEIAQSKGKLWFGISTEIPGSEQLDQEYMTILNDTKIFGQLTPANYMKVRCCLQSAHQKSQTEYPGSKYSRSPKKTSSTILVAPSSSTSPKTTTSACAATTCSGLRTT